MNDDVLRAIDCALTTDHQVDDVAPGSVEELALLLRAEAPVPSPKFVERMDRKVADDFVHPEPTINGRIRRVFRWHPWAGGAVAVAASTVLVALFASTLSVEQSGPGRETPGRSDGTALTADDYEAAPILEGAGGYVGESRSTGGGGRGTAATTGVSSTITDFRRYVLGSGLFLEVERAAVPDVVAGAVAIADELGGYAGSSSYDVGEGSASGSVDLWVPAGEHARAVARLARLGEVTRIVEDREDHTASRNDLVRQVARDRERLRQARANTSPECEENDYCRGQREAIANQLQLREQRLANLDRRIDLSLINLKVEGVDRTVPAPKRWTVGWATDRAGELVERAAAVAIIGAAVLVVPLALLAIGAGLARARRRRDRDGVLDER